MVAKDRIRKTCLLSENTEGRKIMFDILIGTLIPAHPAVSMIKQLNVKGFESYELNFTENSEDLYSVEEYAKKISDVLEGRKISALSFYGNTMCDEEVYKKVEMLIKNAKLFECDRVCIFAGANPELSVPGNMPIFKKVFTPLAKLAEENGVKIGFENCGEGWQGRSHNIAFCHEAWEMMFHEVPSDALGLEWEPAHQLSFLIDPIAQLRKWAKKVVHVHGKDATVAWDIVRESGVKGTKNFAWHRTPGFGDTNWSDVVTILMQNGFKGSIDIEGYHDPVHYDDMEWTTQLASLEYLKRCRGGAEYFKGPDEYHGYRTK